MSRYVNRTVEVDIEDFDDEAVLARASELRSRRGGSSSPMEDGPETDHETLCRLMGNAAAAIASGDQIEALRALDALAGDDRGLRDAVDLGWRRRR